MVCTLADESAEHECQSVVNKIDVKPMQEKKYTGMLFDLSYIQKFQFSLIKLYFKQTFLAIFIHQQM